MNKTAPAATTRYSSKIIKAGALLADTKTLLSHWDLAVSVRENLDLIHRQNALGKPSRSRVEDILEIFRQRYLSEEQVVRALVVLVNRQFPTASLDRILYFHAAQADRLLHDVVTEVLLPQDARGITDINVEEIERVLANWISEGKTNGHWSASTILHIARGLLATLRDFGVLQGAVKKRISPAYLPVTAFAYVAFYLKLHQPSGSKLLEHPDWRLFFLNRDGVERFLFEANQHALLEYHAAGTVTRLTFPVDTLGEYANVLVEKSH